MFYKKNDSAENYWRALILYGANVATYKFALGKSLLELDLSKSNINLDELAILFSKHLSEHVKGGKRQCTNSKSSYLDAISAFNEGKISHDQLISETKKTGFKYVLDAFHKLPAGQSELRFYEIEGSGNKRNLILTDNFQAIKESIQSSNLLHEVEARWNLVEDTWTHNTGTIGNLVQYDIDTTQLIVQERTSYRRSLTFAKNALIGYQKGKCFYCKKSILLNDSIKCDVDHFIPYSLRYKNEFSKVDLNGVWNLVLACSSCNIGIKGIKTGKLDSIPAIRYLQRIQKRNNYLIASNHPLSNTLINLTGSTDESRIKFIDTYYKASLNYKNEKPIWEASDEEDPDGEF